MRKHAIRRGLQIHCSEPQEALPPAGPAARQLQLCMTTSDAAGTLRASDKVDYTRSAMSMHKQAHCHGQASVTQGRKLGL